MQARGINSSSAGFSGAVFRPNAGGGAHNRSSAPQAAAAAVGGGASKNKSTLAATAGNMQRLDARFTAGAVRFPDNDLNDTFGGHVNVAQSAVNAVRASTSRGAGASRTRDRSDRATVEQVLDPRTRMVLFKMLNRGVFSAINGCISTGKEANVYHATQAAGPELAIKVYKTAILVFKDRDRQVQELEMV